MRHVLPVFFIALAANACATDAAQTQPVIGTRSASVIELNGLRFKDLDRNGRLEPFEDWRLAPERRAADLAGRMSLEEKVGLMFHSTLPGIGAPIGASTVGYDLEALRPLVQDKHVNSFISRLSVAPGKLAEQNNQVQTLAESTRWGIPVSISTDPRHHFQLVSGASVKGVAFSQWPETLGLAALQDPAQTRRFAEIASAEYRAVGFRVALSPQADLASEPRWPRGAATFGADPQQVSDQVEAYVQGFQGPDGLGPQSVATAVKHWVGYGAEPEGFDAHSYYGRHLVMDEKSFALHVRAFQGAFSAHASTIMPTYGIITGVTLDGQPIEPVGAGFNRQLLELLREKYHFKGLILSDWAITDDCDDTCRAPGGEHSQLPQSIAMPWGVESLTLQQRLVKGVLAGLDQFGGSDAVQPLLSAVRAGEVPVARIDASAQRILEQKFALGLFENPYVDPVEAERVVGNPQFVKAADFTQRRAQVLLENQAMLPVAPAHKKVFLYGVDRAVAETYGFTVVDEPESAQLAIVRISAPHEVLHPYHFFGRRQHEGRLDFRDGDRDYEAVKRASARVPTIVSVYLDRPAILTNIKDKAAALLVNFGASDAALLDVIIGRATPQGHLPFELPSSMAAVREQSPSLPDDSQAPLYPRGYRF